MKAEIVAIWRTTPKRLREIADYLERTGDKLEVGDVAPEWVDVRESGIVVRLDWFAYAAEKAEASE